MRPTDTLRARYPLDGVGPVTGGQRADIHEVCNCYDLLLEAVKAFVDYDDDALDDGSKAMIAYDKAIMAARKALKATGAA